MGRAGTNYRDRGPGGMSLRVERTEVLGPMESTGTEVLGPMGSTGTEVLGLMGSTGMEVLGQRADQSPVGVRLRRTERLLQGWGDAMAPGQHGPMVSVTLPLGSRILPPVREAPSPSDTWSVCVNAQHYRNLEQGLQKTFMLELFSKLL